MTSVTPPTRHEHDLRADGGVHPRPHRWSWTWVVLSSIAIAGYFVGQYAQGTLASLASQQVGLSPVYAPQGWAVQAAFYLHITFSGLALVLGPWQFARWLRTRRPRVHRTIGRTYLVCVAVGAVAAFVMSMFSSAGIDGFFGFASLAVLWAWTAWRAYRAIRSGEVADHQAWVIRNFALTYAAVTLRLWLGVLILVQLVFSSEPFAAVYAQAYAPLPFLSWLPNIVIAEFLVRRRGLPALRITPAAP